MRTYTFPDEWPPFAAATIYYLWFDFVDWLAAKPEKRRLNNYGQAWPIYNWRLNLEDVILSGRKRNNSGNTPATLQKFNPDRKFQWANAELSDNDLLVIRQHVLNLESVATAFLGLAVDGFEVSVKPTAEGGWMACMFGDTQDGTRHGLSARAKQPVTACAALAYKWYTVLDATWPTGGGSDDLDGIR